MAERLITVRCGDREPVVEFPEEHIAVGVPVTQRDVGSYLMKAIIGIVKHGQISLSQPVGWPDGTPVEVKPVSPEPGDNGVDDELGMSEAEQGDDAESIARWIAEFDAIPPLQMTPEEEAAWQAARKAQKELDKASFNKRAESLRRIWE